jgi:hypothetical protein
LIRLAKGSYQTGAALRATRPAEEVEAKKQRSSEKANEEAKEFGQARILVCQGGDMSEAKANRPAGKLSLILPVTLRITFSLVLWTLGRAPMILTEAQTGKDRLIREMPSNGSAPQVPLNRQNTAVQS